MNIHEEIKEIILTSVGVGIDSENLSTDFPLVGNILDSMAVNNLIMALEEHFNFVFSDEDLSAEAFKTVGTLIELVEIKLEK